MMHCASHTLWKSGKHASENSERISSVLESMSMHGWMEFVVVNNTHVHLAEVAITDFRGGVLAQERMW